MTNNNLKRYLINFEDKIAKLFNEKKIKAPIHLYFGNENKMINIFKKIKKIDWIFCSWRSHYQCLLKGVPEKDLLRKIIQGSSIALCFPKYKIYSSAIVGGSLSIALGVALSAKLKKTKEHVYCFMGDMTSETGIAHETFKYAVNYNLPITFIIEDNGLSVCSETKNIWKLKKFNFLQFKKSRKFIYYKYKNKYPHAGSGTRIQF
jgi:TPP-dependent pyruvate/acetoin dehydrogenase alpha subunit